MMTTSSSLVISIMIPAMVMFLSKPLSKKNNDREKSSPFECGFDPKSSARMPLSIQFFLIAVIFLIFDIEIALILPAMITMKSSNMLIWSCSMSTFMVILLLGLYHEWNQGALKWAE
uniref:NADH-ubiquinone oxidoreductase chain 3 n=1 Tax=Atractomorpha psittacina TaxID=1920482 RepID=A0A6G6A6D2_9ORTH|nr:NADH dehydrogenase subunit 3 [Atractomorpha psittacina]YP_010987349.1 NADH dehydrogenase subunit 3 [Atractomorpha lata]QID03856.1 NADH dehydrogenase subunit 3 [Atractomorpha psittacina]WOL43050.1 NADH dehydrogenase subunit 3 [Atractomorpha lata]